MKKPSARRIVSLVLALMMVTPIVSVPAVAQGVSNTYSSGNTVEAPEALYVQNFEAFDTLKGPVSLSSGVFKGPNSARVVASPDGRGNVLQIDCAAGNLSGKYYLNVNDDKNSWVDISKIAPKDMYFHPFVVQGENFSGIKDAWTEKAVVNTKTYQFVADGLMTTSGGATYRVRGIINTETRQFECKIYSYNEYAYNYLGYLAPEYEYEIAYLYEYDWELEYELLYDEDGEIMYGENGEKLYELDEDGQKIPVLDENGQPKIATDQNGNKIAKKDAKGYDIVLTDENGDPLVYRYDLEYEYTLGADGEKIYTLDNAGRKIPLLDDNGNPVVVIKDGKKSYSLQGEGDKVPVTNGTTTYPLYYPNGERVLRLDDEGNPIPVRDAQGNIVYSTKPLYDDFGIKVPRLVKVDADGKPVYDENNQYIDDPNGKIVYLDANGQPTTDESLMVPMVDQYGDRVYKEVLLSDFNYKGAKLTGTGEYKDVLDANGNPVYEIKLDKDGNPVMEVVRVPVYETNEDGSYKLDENGDKIPVMDVVLDDSGEPVLDENNQPLMEHRHENKVEYLRDENGNIVYEDRQVFVYDENGKLVTVHRYDTRKQALDANGMPIFDRGVDGILTPRWIQEVDADGNPIYDASGKPVYEMDEIYYYIDADGRIITAEMNDDGSFKNVKIQKVDADGNPEVDAAGNPIMEAMTDGEGNPVTAFTATPYMVQATDSEGNLLTDGNGTPVMIQKVTYVEYPMYKADGSAFLINKQEWIKIPVTVVVTEPVLQVKREEIMKEVPTTTVTKVFLTNAAVKDAYAGNVANIAKPAYIQHAAFNSNLLLFSADYYFSADLTKGVDIRVTAIQADGKTRNFDFCKVNNPSGGMVKITSHGDARTNVLDGSYSVPVETWCNISVLADFNAGVYSLYVDGHLVAGRQNIAVAEQTFTKDKIINSTTEQLVYETDAKGNVVMTPMLDENGEVVMTVRTDKDGNKLYHKQTDAGYYGYDDNGNYVYVANGNYVYDENGDHVMVPAWVPIMVPAVKKNADGTPVIQTKDKKDENEYLIMQQAKDENGNVILVPAKDVYGNDVMSYVTDDYGNPVPDPENPGQFLMQPLMTPKMEPAQVPVMTDKMQNVLDEDGNIVTELTSIKVYDAERNQEFEILVMIPVQEIATEVEMKQKVEDGKLVFKDRIEEVKDDNGNVVMVEKQIEALDENGNVVLDDAGNPVMETVMQEKKDEKGNTVLDENGEAVMEPVMIPKTDYVRNEDGSIVQDPVMVPVQKPVTSTQAFISTSGSSWSQPCVGITAGSWNLGHFARGGNVSDYKGFMRIDNTAIYDGEDFAKFFAYKGFEIDFSEDYENLSEVEITAGAIAPVVDLDGDKAMKIDFTDDSLTDKNYRPAVPGFSYMSHSQVVLEANYYIEGGSTASFQSQFHSAGAQLGEENVPFGNSYNAITVNASNNNNNTTNKYYSWIDLYWISVSNGNVTVYFDALDDADPTKTEKIVSSVEVPTDQWVCFSLVINPKTCEFTLYIDGVAAITDRLIAKATTGMHYMSNLIVGEGKWIVGKVNKIPAVASRSGAIYIDDVTSTTMGDDAYMQRVEGLLSADIYSNGRYVQTVTDYNLFYMSDKIELRNVKLFNLGAGQLLTTDETTFRFFDPLGIRFASLVNKENLDAIYNKISLPQNPEAEAEWAATVDMENTIRAVRFGTLIVPTDMLDGQDLTFENLEKLGVPYLDIAGTKDKYYELDGDPTTTHIVGSITNISEKNIDRLFSAVAYVRIVMQNGMVYNVYSHRVEKTSAQSLADDAYGEDAFGHVYTPAEQAIIDAFMAGKKPKI